VVEHRQAHPAVDAGCANHPAAVFAGVRRYLVTTLFSSILLGARNSNRRGNAGRLSRTGPHHQLPGCEVAPKPKGRQRVPAARDRRAVLRQQARVRRSALPPLSPSRHRRAWSSSSVDSRFQRPARHVERGGEHSFANCQSAESRVAQLDFYLNRLHASWRLARR